MKITDYERVNSVQDSDVLLIDGNRGTKTINVNDFHRGHTILDEDGITYPQRSKLQFEGCEVTDDAANGVTVVKCEGGGSKISISTNESTLHGKTVTVTGTSETKTATFDNTGKAEIDGFMETGTVTISASDGTETASVTISIPYFGNYAVSLSFWAATLSISTDSPDLYGQTITVKDSNNQTVATSVFSGQGTATATVNSTGTYTVSATGDGVAVTESVTVSAQTTYNVSLHLWTANVTINVTASVLDGETLTATDGTNTETTTVSNGKAYFNLTPGNWEVAGIPITVVSGQTYTKDIYIYAVHYSETDSNPDSADYPSGYDNYGWTPFAMNLTTGVSDYGSWNPSGTNASKVAWLYPKSCMLKYDGTVDYYLDEDDETKKADGVTASDVASTAYGGNAMMEWGQDGCKIYWKIVPDQDGKGFTFVVANYQADGDMKPWNHYNCEGNVAEHFYTPKYFGSSDGTRLRSISGGTNYVNHNASDELTQAKANNLTAKEIWNTEVYCDWLLIQMLQVLLCKSMNTQSKFGKGRCKSTNPAAIGQGTMNGKGLFWGSDDEMSGVKIFGMENPYGNLKRRIAGLINNNGVVKIKLTYGKEDGSSCDGYNLTGANYISHGTINGGTDGGYISHMNITNRGITPATVRGSDSTYYCDEFRFKNSQVNYPFVGGCWNEGLLVGEFYCALNFAVSLADTTVGVALSCKPLA